MIKVTPAPVSSSDKQEEPLSGRLPSSDFRRTILQELLQDPTMTSSRSPTSNVDMSGLQDGIANFNPNNFFGKGQTVYSSPAGPSMSDIYGTGAEWAGMPGPEGMGGDIFGSGLAGEWGGGGAALPGVFDSGLAAGEGAGAGAGAGWMAAGPAAVMAAILMLGLKTNKEHQSSKREDEWYYSTPFAQQVQADARSGMSQDQLRAKYG